MRLNNLPEDHITLLLGAPRSGTTWLGKILDSHPQVLYRHEPDTVRRMRDLPDICPADQIAAQRDTARAYLRGLMNVTAWAVSASRPVFPKSYRGRLLDAPRRWLAEGLHKAVRYRGLRGKVRACNIPDLITSRQAGKVHLVLKSVRSRGRAGLLAQALPQARIIFIVRDPLGQVAAMLRGMRQGGMISRIAIRDLVATTQARRIGLTEADFQQSSVLEQLAWHWAILNEKALEELADSTRVKILRYEDLCRTPTLVAREVFAFLDLPWHAQTDEFIRQCIAYEGKDAGYRYHRNANRSLERWQGDLRLEDRERIAAVVNQTSLGDRYMLPVTP